MGDFVALLCILGLVLVLGGGRGDHAVWRARVGGDVSGMGGREMITTTANQECCICGLPGSVGVWSGGRIIWYCFGHSNRAQTVRTANTSYWIDAISDNTATIILKVFRA